MARQDPAEDSCKNKTVQFMMIGSVGLFWVAVYVAEYTKEVIRVLS